MSPMVEEGELIRRARGGDDTAFGQLVILHQDRVFAVILRSLNDRETAADLTQEVFISAWKSMSSFDDRAKFSTWLFRVAMNAVVSHIRMKSAQKRGGTAGTWSLDTEDAVQPTTDARGLSAGTVDPGARADATETMERIEHELAELDPDQRTVVVLREIEGLSYDDIAAVLGVEVGTVRSRLHRGREQLRQRLKDLDQA